MSILLPLIFIFYSIGFLNLLKDKNEFSEDCRMRKGCTCCEMNKGQSGCCSNHLMQSILSINIPCNHPNFEGINYKIDFALIIFVLYSQFEELDLQYLSCNFESKYFVFQSKILKPPKQICISSA